MTQSWKNCKLWLSIFAATILLLLPKRKQVQPHNKHIETIRSLVPLSNFDSKIFLTSAYFSSQIGEVVVVAAVSKLSKNQKIYCLFSEKNGDSIHYQGSSLALFHPQDSLEINPFEFGSAVLSCPFNFLYRKNLYVTLSKSKAIPEKNIWVLVENNGQKNSFDHLVTVCSAPIQNRKYDKTFKSWLWHYINLNNVSSFRFYFLPKAMNTILFNSFDQYSAIEIDKVIWILPQDIEKFVERLDGYYMYTAQADGVINIYHMRDYASDRNINNTLEIHYNAQIVALQDCLHKSSFHSTWMTSIDMDELIFYKKTDFVSQYLNRQPSGIDAILFRNSFFNTLKKNSGSCKFRLEFHDDQGLEELLWDTTSRFAHVYSPYDRSKYIIKPHRFYTADVHFPGARRFKNSGSTEIVNPEDGLLLHFRSPPLIEFSTSTIKDESLCDAYKRIKTTKRSNGNQ